jgi:hypothetical protein
MSNAKIEKKIHINKNQEKKESTRVNLIRVNLINLLHEM